MPVIQHPFPVTAVQLVSETDRKTGWITSGAGALHHISFHSQIKAGDFSWKMTLLAGEGDWVLEWEVEEAKWVAEWPLLVPALGVPHSLPPFSQMLKR